MAFIFLFVLFFLFSVSYFLIFFFFFVSEKILSFFSHGLFSFSYFVYGIQVKQNIKCN